MRIIVSGVGPIGGIVGGRLARAGNDVTLVDVNREHVQAIRERGLTVDVPDGPFTVTVPILFPEEIKGKFDLAFLAVRSFNTGPVLSSLRPHLTEDAIVVSLQNGVNLPLLVEFVGPDRAIGTTIRMPGNLVEPGHVRTRVRGHLFIGHLHGRTTPQLTSVHALLNAVIPTEMTDNSLGLSWSKLTFSCLNMFVAIAEGVTLKKLWENEDRRQLCTAFMAELLEVGTAAGVRFEPLEEYNPSDFHPSRPPQSRYAAFAEMVKIDKNRGVTGLGWTEIDYTVGHVVREGERVGIQTPICRALIEMIREIKNGTRPLQWDNYAELEKRAGL